MKVFVSLPEEMLSQNLSIYWEQIKIKLQKEFPSAIIWSSYIGDGSIQEADAVVFPYEYKDSSTCKRDMVLCRKLNKPYNFFLKF